MADSQSRFRPEIEGLRAIAVLSVLAFHSDIRFFEGGFYGVDVFFVISGYVITAMMEASEAAEGRLDIARFFSRRARRLLPSLFPVIGLTMVAGFLLMNDRHFLDLAKSAIAASLTVPNIYFWQTGGYFALDANLRPLLHLWSIGVEIQFYLIWPFLLFFSRRAWRPAIIAIVGMASLAAAYWSTATSDAIFYLTPFRAFEFAIGALLVYAPWKAGSRSSLLLGAGLLAILAGVHFLNAEMHHQVANALLPCLGCGLAIYAGRSELGQALLANRCAVWFGQLSYSLYLTHWPVAVFWQYAVYETMTWAGWCGVFVTSLILAVALQYFIETPFRKNPTRVVRGREAVAYSIAVVLLLAGSGLVAAGDGLPSRIDRGLIALQPGAYENCSYPLCFHPDRNGQIQLVVVGDSHARHLWSGLDALTRDRDFGFAIFHFDKWCRPTNQKNIDQGYDCKERLDGLTRFLEKYRPSHMLFAVRWINFDATTGDQLRSAMKQPQWTSVRSMAIMLNVPEFYLNRDPAGCLVPSYILDPVRRCGDVPRSEPFIKVREALNASATAEFPGIVKFNPFDVFCDAMICHQIMHGAFVYADKHHLTDASSILLLTHFKKAFLAWLDGNGRDLQAHRGASQ